MAPTIAFPHVSHLIFICAVCLFVLLGWMMHWWQTPVRTRRDVCSSAQWAAALMKETSLLILFLSVHNVSTDLRQQSSETAPRVCSYYRGCWGLVFPETQPPAMTWPVDSQLFVNRLDHFWTVWREIWYRHGGWPDDELWWSLAQPHVASVPVFIFPERLDLGLLWMGKEKIPHLPTQQ